MKRQTAVEWLESELDFLYQYMTERNRSQLFDQAKAMEKEQMEKCYDHATLTYLETGHGDLFEDYFNKTYGGDE